MPAIGGDFTLTISGKQIVTMPDCTIRLSGTNRELAETISRDGKPRYTQRSTPGMLKVRVVTDSDQDLAWLLNLTNAAGTLESVSGHTYRLANLTRIGETPEIDIAAGSYELEFTADVRLQ